MRNLVLLITTLSFSFTYAQQKENKLPKSFIYIQEIIPDAQVDIRYLTADNFVGKPVNGYKKNVAILTKPATLALAKVEKELNSKNLGIKIFDTYRPQRAVDHFKVWAKAIDDTITKRKYYPNIDKRNLFRDGFIASKSAHSRGSTIDLTIIDLKTKKELDMGTVFDFFGPQSAHSYPKLTKTQKKNREILKSVMMKYGFKPYAKEWWHYTYINEPYKNTYFDFEVQ